MFGPECSKTLRPHQEESKGKDSKEGKASGRQLAHEFLFGDFELLVWVSSIK